LIFCSPSNPTGAVYPKDEIEEIGRWAADNGIWVITDEIYEHLVYGDSEHFSMPTLVPDIQDRCVVLNGVAKTYAMTGWRVGWIIAPHDISKNNIKRIKRNINSKYSIYSDILDNNVRGNILILDTIGHLKRIYKYSDLSYVGGGMGNKGLHNILEACIFKIPVVIGKNYHKFKESVDLVNLGGVISVKNQDEFDNELNKLINNEEYRLNKINITKKYFKEKKAATNLIIKNLTL